MAGRIDFILGVAGQYAISATIKACGYFCSFHQMTPTVHGRTHYLFIDPERINGWSWPGWLSCKEWFTHASAASLQERKG